MLPMNCFSFTSKSPALISANVVEHDQHSLAAGLGAKVSAAAGDDLRHGLC